MLGSHWAEYLPNWPLVARAAQALEAAARPLGDAVVAVSAFTLARMGYEASPTRRVVGNGVVAARQAGETAAAPSRDIDVVSVGRLIDEKRIDRLIGAVAALRDQGRDINAVIVGDGPARSDLEDSPPRSASPTGSGSRVAYRIARLQRCSDGVASPSCRPTARDFGIAVLEARAAGAVPIVTNGPYTAAPDLVDDGVDGLVVEPDERAIARAIVRLMDDDDEREALRAAGLVSVLRHDWACVADEMAMLYAQVARRAPIAVPTS